ncbi:MAG: hypothetical protein ACT4TC_05755 [Myxococcaceae bacterium]
MNRRSLLAGLAAGTAISTLDWLRFFRSFGVPGSRKELGIAEAVAQTAATPRFLVYWFCEGGWDGYSMFNPVDTPNHATLTIPAGTLNPNPSWSAQRYRPTGYGTAPVDPPKTQGNITYGFLAQDGLSLFPDLAVVSSHFGNTFHSGSRFEYHYGKYNASLSGQRAADERTVLQAFCEAYGQSYLMPHVSWHRWLADGELSVPSYPEGTGYYEKLGPAYAHTVYGKTPADMRNRLSSLGQAVASARGTQLRAFVDNLHDNFIKDKNSETVKAFSSAVQIHRQLQSGQPSAFNPSTLFTDTNLRSQFGIQTADEQTSAASINGNPARSKESPNANVQALMAYELMTKGLSIGFWIESRDLRDFDSHRSRSSVFNSRGQYNQRTLMQRNVWNPLKAFVTLLKNTPYGSGGGSYWDYTTIVLASEMGRVMYGDAQSILANTADSDATKYTKVMDQDVCEHWRTSSVAFLGGTVRGNTQFGRVGTSTLDAIPMMPDGTLDPAYEPVTGSLKPGATKSTQSFVSDAGHVYATALSLTGLSPTGKGRNTRPAMGFIKK